MYETRQRKLTFLVVFICFVHQFNLQGLIAGNCCPDEFTCITNQHYIPNSNVCDGNNDCLDGSDEGGQCKEACTSKNNPCDQLCHPTPTGPSCACNNGYNLGQDEKTCNDIDECLFKKCSQKCQNTLGSFQCSCFEGYSLSNDNVTCKLKVENISLIVVSTIGQIHKSNLITNKSETLVCNDDWHNTILNGLDLDVRKKIIYWSNEKLGTMNQLNLITQEKKIMNNIGKPIVIATDWITGNIYFFDSEKSTINIYNFGKNKSASIISIGKSYKVGAIALDVINGFMYWSQMYNSDGWSKIFRAEMNGNNTKIIVSQHLGYISGIAVHFYQKKLYWVDTTMYVYEETNLDGSQRQKFQLSYRNDYDIYGANIYADSIYFIVGNSEYLQQCLLFGDRACQFIRLENEVRTLFSIMEIMRQPMGKNYCEDQTCDYLCVLKKLGSSCIRENESLLYTNINYFERPAHYPVSTFSEQRPKSDKKMSIYFQLFIIIAVTLAAILLVFFLVYLLMKFFEGVYAVYYDLEQRMELFV